MRKEGSQCHWGSYTSNCVAIGNFNACKDVESEHYDQIREFMATETNAIAVSASLHHFDTDSPDDPLVENKPPEGIQRNSSLEKRTWLHNYIAVLFDKYISVCFSSLSTMQKSLGVQAVREKTRLLCQSPGCIRLLIYPKCRLNHEKDVHAIVIEDYTQISSPEDKTQRVEDELR